MMGLVAYRIQQIKRFAMGFIIINIIENHFVSQSLHCELECQVGTYVSRTDDADFSCFNCHFFYPPVSPS